MPHDFSTVFDNQVLCKYCGKSNPETPGNIRKVDDINLCPQQQQQQPVSILRVLLLNQRCCAVHIVDVDSCVLILMAAADYMLLA